MSEQDRFENEPADVISFKRPRGRPPGSKNRPKPEPDSPAVPPPTAEERERPPLFREEGTAVVTTTAAVAWSVTADPAFAERLAAMPPEGFGRSSRSSFTLVRDVSPSEAVHQAAFVSGAARLTEVFGSSELARYLIDCLLIEGAHDARIRGFAHGELEIPPFEMGYSTNLMPWLRTFSGAFLAWQEHLGRLGVGTRDSVLVVASDFCFADYDRAEVDAFKRWADDRGVVVVAGMFGDAEADVARQVADPLPAVDLSRVPVDAFLSVLARTHSASMSRRGVLKELLRAALEKL